MKFQELYTENRKSVVETLKQLWCSETANDSQRAYAKHIEKIIPELFAPNDAIPLVQCMNLYKSVFSVSNNEAEAIVGGFWSKIPKKTYFPPYEHQYQCWKHLLEEQVDGLPKSICITTGTGSGKTECFMLPLVYDLDLQQKQNPSAERYIQALFIYPLNALMEDQKGRLEQLLEGTNLTYAVYNGDLPEKEPDQDDNSEYANKMRAQIKQIRGWDDERQEYRFKHILYTREQVRKQRPNILLTNPTMLEYILLRKSDESLINIAAKSLRWIAIDETHTYTGAGAAELAMLLRRVLLAFDVDAHRIRFATSSATFGNADSISDPEERAKAKIEDERKLKEFIAGITGTGTEQIEIVGGERTGKDKIPNNEDKMRWTRILDEEFVTLNSLFPNLNSIEAQLHALDEMVDRMGNCTDLKVKVHYFYRVPNNGIFARIDQINEDGTFELYTENKLTQTDEIPLIELARCKHCGEYVVVVLYNEQDGSYKGVESDDSDIFDLESIPKDDNFKIKVLGLSNSSNIKGQGNSIYKLIGGKLRPALPAEVKQNEWHIVANQHNKCPYCNSQLSKNKESNSELDAITAEDRGENRILKKFRVSAEFISRVIAPSILEQMDKFPANHGEKLLHDGQQFISFADSRQLAAQATLKQNQEQERVWFYSTIYHELCKKAAMGNKTIEDLTNNAIQSGNAEKIQDIALPISNQNGGKTRKAKLSWAEIAELISNNEYCDRFCYEFVKRTANSSETDIDGHIDSKTKEKYVQSIMAMYLTSRPRSAAAPETMGLFHPCYDKLEGLTVPKEVEDKFNSIIQNEENRIAKEDWKNLLQVFIDFRVRSDQSVYLEQKGLTIDIFDTVRFAIERSHRKPASKPNLDPKVYSTSRIVRYLCALLRKDNPGVEDDKKVYQIYFDAINTVVDAMWKDLTETTTLLQVGRHYDEESGRWVNDKDGGIRLNLADMSFTLFEKVYICDSNSEYDEGINHAECLRPIEVHFKNFSPYLSNGVAVELNKERYSEWRPYPYYIGSGQEKNIEDIKQWSKQSRSNLWIENHEIWGENGVFHNRLNEIHHGPNLFIQAEHTAQINKMISRKLQYDFKKHRINILACSTTMEMGVDLGTLQLVMLGSVPAQPANYKQRAGRSGRNPKMVRSACITLCGSDVIGLRTLTNPLRSIINRSVEVPKVDLMSSQVVQRHANSFLVRSLKVFGNGSISQKVIDYYTKFYFDNQGKDVLNEQNQPQNPTTKLGDPKDTMYSLFNQKCNPSSIPSCINNNLEILLRDTIYAGQMNEVIDNARNENKRCYRELNDHLENIECAFRSTEPSEVRFCRKLTFDYKELLGERLLNFWATHRFTPNANMPINVLELDLDPIGKREWGLNSVSSNPSYSLREAIAQYSPGNSVVIDGVVYAVRGIEFKNQYQGAKAFKKIARNKDKTVVGADVDTLANKISWWDNHICTEIELVEPVGFIPDINEENTRIIEKNAFTQVNAQLIDTNEWTRPYDGNHLYGVQCNRDSGNAKILYYNEGIGYGYCLCTRCGRMVLETGVCIGPTTTDLPDDYNTLIPKKLDESTNLRIIDRTKPYYHLAISGKEVRKKCSGSNDANAIHRNVIIGGLLQTDFSKIRIRHKGHNWIKDNRTDRNLLFTLGIVFTQALVELLGKERNAVDFTILPFGYICIFDTNPGGAGYSNQLAQPTMMDRIIDVSQRILLEAKTRQSKDVLLDKFTLRYAKYIDIDKALAWIAEEKSKQNVSN